MTKDLYRYEEPSDWCPAVPGEPHAIIRIPPDVGKCTNCGRQIESPETTDA